ncbi:MAG: hypothetical protein KDN05_18580, partial [Verrucomicrobiae bacterium]|nr:hypothetical protein [Verrucomicrobiae bacterium]
MKLAASSISRSAVIAGACLLLSSASLMGLDFVETDPSDTADLLASDRAAEVTTGERILADNGSVYIDVLLGRIRTGAPEAKGKAAAELGILISPWIRGKESGARSRSFTSFEAPRRPVARVPHLAGADEIRQTIQSAVGNLLKEADDLPEPSHGFRQALEALCETLGEVADDGSMDWVIAELARIDSPRLAEPLIAFGDSYLGIPPVFRCSGLCGNSSREEVERFQRSQEREYSEARTTLGKHWTEVRPLETHARIEFAIGSWRRYFLPRQRSQSGHYRSRKEDWIFLDM